MQVIAYTFIPCEIQCRYTKVIQNTSNYKVYDVLVVCIVYVVFVKNVYPVAFLMFFVVYIMCFCGCNLLRVSPSHCFKHQYK